jgi:hypothetical protein
MAEPPETCLARDQGRTRQPSDGLVGHVANVPEQCLFQAFPLFPCAPKNSPHETSPATLITLTEPRGWSHLQKPTNPCRRSPTVTLRHSLLVVGLVCALTVGASNVHAAKGVKKKGDHHHRGVVVSVEKDSITIKTHHHKKKKNLAVGAVKTHEKTFTIDTATKVEIDTKGEHKPATLKALHKGEHVTIASKDKHADKIDIHHHHKKKKKAA